MKLNQDDRRKLPRLLDDLAEAVEELLLTGLTTASESTRQKLEVAFREAARMRLLRLGSTLRVANEELGRYVRKEEEFSARRLVFFLTRAWLLSHGLARALRANDESQFDRLLWTAATQPVERLEVVTLGVAKRVVKRAFCAFEFRLRVVGEGSSLPEGTPLVWSCVFPVKQDVEIPAEGFLHLPQKQKFKASQFLDRHVIVIDGAAAAFDGQDQAVGRISLVDESRVTAGETFDRWQPLFTWDPQAALARLGAYSPSPLDLEVELQEEVVLEAWEVDKAEKREEEGQFLYRLHSMGLELEAPVAFGRETAPVVDFLNRAGKQQRRPPLFGLMHYDLGRLVFQPLSTIDEQGPQYLTISKDQMDRKALLQALKF